MVITQEQHYFDVFLIDTMTGTWAMSIERLPGRFNPMQVKMHFRPKKDPKRIVQII
jgi:hypothetical protein